MKSETFSERSSDDTIQVDISNFLLENPKINIKFALSTANEYRYYVTIFYEEGRKK